MDRLDQLIDKLKGFDADILATIEAVVRENEATILDMNAEDQLFLKGIDRNGVSISDYAPYSEITKEIKRMKGQPTARVTLRDEGDFHSSFYIEYLADGFKIGAKDGKTEKLVKKYGNQILGLTDENVKELATEYIKPELNEKLKLL